MITNIQTKDIPIITDFIHTHNHTHSQYSAYCYKDKNALLEEVRLANKQNQCFVYKENTIIKGVVIFVETPNETYDIIGPFVLNDDLTIAQKLLVFLTESLPKNPMNFFFNKTSSYYQSLMTYLKASLNEYEYRLTLDKHAFQPTTIQVNVKQAKIEDKAVVKNIHDDIFSNMYLTSDMVLDNSRYNHVYLLEKDEKTVGYALIIPKKQEAYLEVFGITKPYRGLGLAQPFLSNIIETMFEKPEINKVVLIVDVVNERALNLYTKLGFTVTDALVSYTLN